MVVFMFLDTDLSGLTVALLGAGAASRSARRLEAAGADVVVLPPGGHVPASEDSAPGTAPSYVVVVGEPDSLNATLARLRRVYGPLPVARVPAERTGVTLVGGGPGAEDLMTTRGLEAVADADVILLDRLAPQEVVATQAPHAQIIRVGKWPGHHPVPQEQIQSILLNAADQNRHVVRLKGGDPYVFGRGGEEAADCESWGVPVQVVPGITSAVSVPGAAGIPVTFREVARTFTVASGHVPFDDDELSGFARLLKTGATLVVLMGVATLPHLVAGLMRHGARATTPIALVESGFSPDQKVLTSVLASAVVDLASGASPAVTVIGPVAALASEDREQVLGELTPHRAIARGHQISTSDYTFSTSITSSASNTSSAANISSPESQEAADPVQTPKPLEGRTVAVTAHRRADDQIGALERKGAKVIAAPSLKLVPVEEDAAVVSQTRDLLAAAPDLMVVTTGYGFKRWWEVVEASGRADGVHAMLAAADIWVRGPKGRAAVRGLDLHDVGISPDETVATLVDDILDTYDHDLTGAVVGWQENGFHDRHQRQRLVEAGAAVHTVVPHRWADADDAGVVPDLIRQICAREVDAVTFTSAAGSDALLSSASEMGLEEQFVAAFSPVADGLQRGADGLQRGHVVAATVGPVTAAPLQAAGIPALVPERFRMGAMINQLAEVLTA